jgi:lysophospholipase L1-like esterase
MKRHIATGATLLVLLTTLGSCASVDEIRPGALDTGRADFSRLVILGDSFGAGIQSNGLVERNQRTSFGALVARQAGVDDFEIPAVAEPGVPKLLGILSLSPLSIGMPPPVDDPGAYPGRFVNLDLPRPYNNLSIPGARTARMLATNLSGGPPQLDPFVLFAPLILRPQGGTVVSAVDQAAALDPTFLILELGINDLGGGIFNGTTGTITSPLAYASAMTMIVDRLVLGGGEISGVVLLNVPSPTAYPFMTTIPWFVTTPAGEPVLDGAGHVIPLIGMVAGQARPLPPGSLVTLQAAPLLAQGFGLPPGIPGANGQPLPDNVVLDNAAGGERATAEEIVAAYNRDLRTLARTIGATYVDLDAVLQDAVEGLTVGGVEMSADFVTGGLFSLDGIHPSSLGHALAANVVIEAINRDFGANIPPVNLNEFLGVTYDRGRVAPTGAMAIAPGAMDPAAPAQTLRFFPAHW